MNAFTNFISTTANAHIANTVLTPTSNLTSGQKTLMNFLTELEHRTILLGDCKNAREFDLMHRACGDILQLAVADWKLFCATYIVTISFRDAVSTSNVFGLKIKENNECPREWGFRFTNLKRPA